MALGEHRYCHVCTLHHSSCWCVQTWPYDEDDGDPAHLVEWCDGKTGH